MPKRYGKSGREKLKMRARIEEKHRLQRAKMHAAWRADVVAKGFDPDDLNSVCDYEAQRKEPSCPSSSAI
jgi:hypothetical protein